MDERFEMTFEELQIIKATAAQECIMGMLAAAKLQNKDGISTQELTFLYDAFGSIISPDGQSADMDSLTDTSLRQSEFDYIMKRVRSS